MTTNSLLHFICCAVNVKTDAMFEITIATRRGGPQDGDFFLSRGQPYPRDSD